MSLKAGGVGLNLTAASNVFLMVGNALLFLEKLEKIRYKHPNSSHHFFMQIVALCHNFQIYV